MPVGAGHPQAVGGAGREALARELALRARPQVPEAGAGVELERVLLHRGAARVGRRVPADAQAVRLDAPLHAGTGRRRWPVGRRRKARLFRPAGRAVVVLRLQLHRERNR